ncbi:MAG: prepilin-type N-terminal cleavage/methylation domain-containing protein [Planctomycetia bacterium]|nr:prepilin-type N-terminal cleavage/methylation domain-containing protein [Planctomycetia bacterium]
MIRDLKRQRRAGFTLIELLVVIGILLFLFGLTVAFLPAVYQRDGAARGAQVLQAALAEARQRARRDKLNTGLRIAPTRAQFCERLTWVQQPVDLTGGTLSAPRGNSNVVQITGGDLGRVQAGDHLIIHNSGVPHRIFQVDAGSGGLGLFAPLPYPIPATTEYRIVRQPTPMLNQPAINLPANVAVDFTACSFDGRTPLAKTPMFIPILLGSGTTPPGFEIIFSPNGSVTGQWGGIDRVILYVRDTKDSDAKSGSPNVVCVLVRTGLVSVHPADNGGVHPYTFCDSARSSGL